MAVTVFSPELQRDIEICGARLTGPGKHGDGICHARPDATTGFCKRHVNLEGSRPAPGGKYGSFLAPDLLTSYRAARQSVGEDQLHMMDELHLLDVRLSTLVEALNGENFEQVFAEIGVALIDIRTYMEADPGSRDTLMLSVAVQNIEKAVGGVASDRRTWNDIMGVIRARKELVESEQKRVQASASMLSKAQTYNIIRVLIEIINQRVIDGDTRRMIASDIDQLVQGGQVYIDGVSNTKNVASLQGGP